MNNRFFVCLTALVMSSTAEATTISFSTDQLSYIAGDTITLTITGDATGAAADGIYGRLLYDPAVADSISAAQIPLTSDGVPWIDGVLSYGDGYVEVWDQIAGFDPLAPDGPAVSTVQILATHAGPLDLRWSQQPGLELNFFGTTGVEGSDPVFSVEVGENPNYTPPPPPVVEPPPPPVIEPPPPPPAAIEPPPPVEPAPPPPVVELPSSPPDGSPIEPVAAPEPSAALIFSIGLVLAAAAVRR
jgi:hypothetical protein